MFFSGWQPIVRILVVGFCAYAGLVLFLRISGKRTLSKMNAFDFVVTVALGSTLATVILSKDVVLAEGLFAFALLIALQYVITWLSVRTKVVEDVVKSEPRLILRRGEFLRQALRDERIAEEEVRQAIRSQGHLDLSQIDAVVLETDGSFSVISDSKPESASAMKNVEGWD